MRSLFFLLLQGFFPFSSASPALSGEKVCEEHGSSESRCNAIGCCYWDNGNCLSSIGNVNCESFALSGEEVCEGHFSESRCNAIGCCYWDKDYCLSGIGNDNCERMDLDLSGEEVCEGHSYSEPQCLVIGCCGWDDDNCWSSVGSGSCDGSRLDDYAERLNTQPLPSESSVDADSGKEFCERLSKSDCLSQKDCCDWGFDHCYASFDNEGCERFVLSDEDE